MYERYPISGIKQSYRPVPGTKTVVMPLVIAALGVGMVVFYFKGEGPEKTTTASPPAPTVTSRLPETTILPDPIKAISIEPGTKTAAMPPAAEKFLPIVTNEGVAENDFTLWMSPLALDTFIRQRNRGFEKTYWERGHWIKAVEGRWGDGAHEFRIAIAKMPDEARLHWYYRIDQTEREFSETLQRLEKEGYSLAQSQDYDHPDGTKRYQGVWQKEASAFTATESSRGLTGPAPGLQALDVSKLNFR